MPQNFTICNCCDDWRRRYWAAAVVDAMRQAGRWWPQIWVSCRANESFVLSILLDSFDFNYLIARRSNPLCCCCCFVLMTGASVVGTGIACWRTLTERVSSIRNNAQCLLMPATLYTTYVGRRIITHAGKTRLGNSVWRTENRRTLLRYVVVARVRI